MDQKPASPNQGPPQSSPTRRDFLKAGTVAAAASTLSLNSGLYAGTSDLIKIGLVGCGGRGTGAARDSLSTKHNVKLVAIGDVFEDRVNGAIDSIKGGLGDKANKVDVKPELKFTGFDAYDKVINSDVDVVILATPPGFRPVHFEAAVAAGKHIFMEKPVAVDATGVRRVLAANEIAKKKNLKIGVGLQRHHQLGYLETVKRIHDGEIGDLIALRVYWNQGLLWEPPLARENAKNEMEYQLRNWYYYNWLCGDHIVEQHIHNLDVGNWVKGAHPVRAWGMGGRQVRTAKRFGEIFDHHAVEFEFPDGSRMYSQCRHMQGCWNSVAEYAHGTKGTANISGHELKSGSSTWKFGGGGGNPYQVEHDDLLDAIRADREFNEAEYGAHSTMTAILGRMATYSGKEVSWDDALASETHIFPPPGFQFSWDAQPPVLPDENGVYPIAVPGLTPPV